MHFVTNVFCNGAWVQRTLFRYTKDPHLNEPILSQIKVMLLSLSSNLRRSSSHNRFLLIKFKLLTLNEIFINIKRIINNIIHFTTSLFWQVMCLRGNHIKLNRTLVRFRFHIKLFLLHKKGNTRTESSRFIRGCYCISMT